MRVKNQRTGRWVEVPDDDGLAAVVRWRSTALGLEVQHTLLPPEQAEQSRARIAEQMAAHDRRSRRDRWGGNQWGEGWVVQRHRRVQLEREAPLLKTDRVRP